MGTVWWKLLFEKFLFFCRFWSFRANLLAFCRRFSKPSSELLFSCRKEHFEEIVFWKKSVYPLVTMSKELLAICHKIFLAWSEKRQSMCPEAQFGEEFIYCFEINFVFFSLPYIVTFLRLQAKQFSQRCQNCILRVHWKLLRKITFLQRKIMFLKHFWTPCRFSAIIPIFWRNRQNCIPIVQIAFRGSFFLKKFFCYSWARSKNIWSFVEDFQTGFSNFILRVHRKFLRNNLFFGKK